jgi:hypothetical protein
VGAKLFFFAAALAGMILLAASGVSQTQSQPRAPQVSAKAGAAYIKVTNPGRNVIWEKGRSYPIRWECRGVRGNVRIFIVSESGTQPPEIKAGGTRQVGKRAAETSFEVANGVTNDGIHSLVVPGNLPDGIYRVLVMTMDESVKGESAGIITIRSQKAATTAVTSDAEKPRGTPTPPAKTHPSAGAATTTATSAAASAGTAAAKATPPAGGGPTAKSTTTTATVSGQAPTAAAKVVKGQVQSVKVPETTLNKFKFQASTATAPDYRIGGHSATGGTIEVFSPIDGAIWEAEKEYGIRWKSTGITGDVKITLAYGLVVGGKRTEYPIVERTADTGSYLFRVPRNWFPQNQPFHVRVSTPDGSVSGFSPGGIKVYTQYVDLVCMIVDPGVWEQTTYYPFVGKTQKWFEFNVWWKNNGTRFVKQIWPVLVRIIKEPEELVCYQEEWGVSEVYPYTWYQLPDPRRFDIESWKHTFVDYAKHVDLGKGAYRVEVELDTHNSLGEDQQLRENNKAVVRWTIK